MSGTVCENRSIFTKDEAVPLVPTMTVRGERIVVVDSLGKCRGPVGPRAARLDSQGRTVLPGMTHCYLHVNQPARSRTTVDISSATDLQDGRNQLYRQIEPTTSAGCILGGWL